MKRTLVFLLALAMLLAAASPCVASETILRTVTNPAGRYRISVPASWQQEGGDDAEEIQFTSGEADVLSVIYLPFEPSTQPPVEEVVSVITQNMTSQAAQAGSVFMVDEESRPIETAAGTFTYFGGLIMTGSAIYLVRYYILPHQSTYYFLTVETMGGGFPDQAREAVNTFELLP